MVRSTRISSQVSRAGSLLLAAALLAATLPAGAEPKTRPIPSQKVPRTVNRSGCCTPHHVQFVPVDHMPSW